MGYYLSVGGEVAGFARVAPVYGDEPRAGYGDELTSLKDVFEAIVRDEADHVLTMRASRGDTQA